MNKAVFLLLLLSVLLQAASAAPAQTPAPPPVPAWVPSAVIYEVNPAAFSADGTFDGIRARLPQLQQLGVTTLWLMPIQPLGVKKAFGSFYCIRDYEGIRSSLGTADDLHRLIADVHRRRMKIILDLVADHTSWDNPLITSHPEWYKHDAQGNIVPPNDAWKDVAGLDYASSSLRTYMIGVMRYWLQTFDVDGFRCDAAGLLPTEFWEQARVTVDQIKPGALMLAEADQPDLMQRAFDVNYDWNLLTALNTVLEKGASASDVQAAWIKETVAMPARAVPMQIADDHDETRATVKFGPAGAMAASALILTLNGVPLIYNGMEVGDTGQWTPIDWSRAASHPEIPRFYQEMIALRRRHPALQQGATQWLENGDPAHLVTFTRTGEGEGFLVAVNLSNLPVATTVTLPGGTGSWRDVTPDWKSLAEKGAALPEAVLPSISLEAYGFRVFQRR